MKTGQMKLSDFSEREWNSGGLLRHFAPAPDKCTSAETHEWATALDLVHFFLCQDLEIAFELLQCLFGL